MPALAPSEKPESRSAAVASGFLAFAASAWFITAVIGQVSFAAYTAIYYGGTAIQGDLAKWNDVMFHGLVAGDKMGNMTLAIHLALAVVITLGGPLQLMPNVRRAAPTFHRWTGRIYLLTAVAMASTGLWLTWSRGPMGGTLNGIAVSGNAVLILIFAALAVRYAIAREIDTHRRWATRLFLAVSGVWFLRVMLMFWGALTGGAGLGEILDGPMGHTLQFAQYVVPLAVYELYLRTQDKSGSFDKAAMALALLSITAAMAVGIGLTILVMWMPRLSNFVSSL